MQDPSNVPTAQPAPVMMAPSGMYYNPNTPQPIVMVSLYTIAVCVLYLFTDYNYNSQIQQPPDYDYIPSNYVNLSFFMTVLCGIFSPLMVFFTIPAIILGLKVICSVYISLVVENIT